MADVSDFLNTLLAMQWLESVGLVSGLLCVWLLIRQNIWTFPIGLIYAAELARELGRIDDGRVVDHRRVVAGEYDLMTAPPPGLDADELVALMRRDKKALDGMTFVLDGARGVEVVAGVDEGPVRAALERMIR